MATTNFVPGTVITSEFLNDVQNAEHLTFDPAGTGATPRSVENKLREMVSVKDFGAVGDGVTNDSAAIAAALTASVGKKLYFPVGTYLTNAISINSLTGVNICGEDKYSTILKLNAGQNTHLLAYVSAINCTLENITLDQNGTNQTGGHGIRVGGVNGLTIRNVIITECNDYGLGIQDGTNTNVFVDGFEISGTGIDGIDIKDVNLNNENIILSNGIIKDFGREGSASGGFDVRGPAVVSNMQIVCQNTNNRGFRLRVETVQGRAGSGTYENINILITNNTAIGFNTEGATNNNFTINNVVVRGGALGVIGSTAGLYKNLTGYGATTSESLSVAGLDNDIDGLVIDGATRGVDLEPAATGNTISAFNIKNITGTDAFRIQATADNNSLLNGVVQSGKAIADSGTNTTIRSVRNWRTAANLISADLALDSTGTRNFTIAHGLAVTPTIQDCTLTLTRVTNVADHRIGLMQIDNVDATNIAGRLVVTTASATVGAVGRVTVLVRAKNS